MDHALGRYATVAVGVTATPTYSSAYESLNNKHSNNRHFHRSRDVHPLCACSYMCIVFTCVLIKCVHEYGRIVHGLYVFVNDDVHESCNGLWNK